MSLSPTVHTQIQSATALVLFGRQGSPAEFHGFRVLRQGSGLVVSWVWWTVAAGLEVSSPSLPPLLLPGQDTLVNSLCQHYEFIQGG